MRNCRKTAKLYLKLYGETFSARYGAETSRQPKASPRIAGSMSHRSHSDA